MNVAMGTENSEEEWEEEGLDTGVSRVKQNALSACPSELFHHAVEFKKNHASSHLRTNRLHRKTESSVHHKPGGGV